MSYIETNDFDYQIALGNVPGYETWNKFGYNDAIGIGTEVIAKFGGTWEPMAAAETMSIVSTSADDATGGVGAASVLIYGLDNAYAHITELVFLNGLTPVVSTNSFRAINRVVIYLAGTNKINTGDITVTSSTSATIEAQVLAGQGTTQQCMYTTSATGTILMRSLFINALKLTGGAAPKITIKAWVYSDVSKAKYEVFRTDMDTSVDNHIEYNQTIPFVVTEKSTIWFEATTDKADTAVNLRFSFIERDL